ncbi:F0F1 ATP synthase subunit B [Leptolyngbya sp. PCC 6406]|uniref:F0F1 ATP synthase subunit B n=1 Tax=Leptolyngbya sp. PCC 6406 TaxID=1173264 RepID=UPI0002AC1BF0|nr:F0F1 ATP synthase subunit B [Leptolyngbya sp. PCC 6406]
MTMLWLLATEEGGFGLNSDILETNLINLVIVIGVLIYFGKKFLGSTLTSRRVRIEEAIQDAEARKKKASSALAEQQQNLAQAKAKAEQILAEAQENAAKAREALLAQAKVDVERLQASAAQDLSSQQERVLRELRQQVTEMAIARAKEQLPGRLNQDIQHRLIDQSIAMLGG